MYVVTNIYFFSSEFCMLALIDLYNVTYFIDCLLTDTG